MRTRLPPPGADFQRPPGLYFDWQAVAPAVPARMPGGVPLFVGLTGATQMAQDAEPVRCLTRWQQFDEAFPDDEVSSLLACAVRGFFENGGRLCYVMPVGLSPAPPAGVTVERHAGDISAALTRLFATGGALEQIDEIDLVCVPDIMTGVIACSVASVIELQSHVVNYCARMGDRFAILDVHALEPQAKASDTHHDEAVMNAVSQWQSLPASYGAIYFPWLRVAGHRAGGDAARTGTLVPPCGHVAGVYARSDRRVGAHKPPANEPVEGVLDLSFNLDDREQTRLNGAGVNCLRSSPGWGIRVWGARTLSDRSAWMYVNVTRVMLALKRWLEHDLRDLVFELNTPVLWTIFTERIERHCMGLYRHGALKGTRPSEAFFVKCDAEINPPYSVDSGVVVAQVGLAPEMPAEFVIVRITQSASGVTVTGPTATL